MDALPEHLFAKRLLSAADIERIDDVRRRTNGRFASTAVRLGLVAEEDIASAFSTLTDTPIAKETSFSAEALASSGCSRHYLARHSAIPLAQGDTELLVAMADPADTETIAGIEFATGMAVRPVVATFSEIADFFSNSADHTSAEFSSSDFATGADEDVERVLEGDSEAPVVRVVHRLLSEAITRRASDIHIEPMARYVAVRFRIDGRLIEAERLPEAIGKPIASRVKVMASLDIAESRLPQDGRLRFTLRGRDVDVRVSTSPTAWGESVVLRLLGRTDVPLDIERLGLPPTALATLLRALDRPHGIILLTGPTGSGKTTTLYAAISRLRRPEVKILTVEDPVEVLLEGVNQVQVRPEIDLSYAATLRAFLRQDPDILMIGEIRDQETAEIAMRAALTGHLVLSTLHTNSALGAFTRLADIGVEPYLTASTVIATIAQRLIRALCRECRQPRAPSLEEGQRFQDAGIAIPDAIYEPGDCPRCLRTGYSGRLPLIEIIELDDALRNHVRSGQVEGMADNRPVAETLYGHGLALIAEGKTSFAEVQRAVQLQ